MLLAGEGPSLLGPSRISWLQWPSRPGMADTGSSDYIGPRKRGSSASSVTPPPHKVRSMYTLPGALETGVPESGTLFILVPPPQSQCPTLQLAPSAPVEVQLSWRSPVPGARWARFWLVGKGMLLPLSVRLRALGMFKPPLSLSPTLSPHVPGGTCLSCGLSSPHHLCPPAPVSGVEPSCWSDNLRHGRREPAQTTP